MKNDPIEELRSARPDIDLFKLDKDFLFKIKRRLKKRRYKRAGIPLVLLGMFAISLFAYSDVNQTKITTREVEETISTPLENQFSFFSSKSNLLELELWVTQENSRVPCRSFRASVREIKLLISYMQNNGFRIDIGKVSDDECINWKFSKILNVLYAQKREP